MSEANMERTRAARAANRLGAQRRAADRLRAQGWTCTEPQERQGTIAIDDDDVQRRFISVDEHGTTYPD